MILFACRAFSPFISAQNASEWLAGLPQAKDYASGRQAGVIQLRIAFGRKNLAYD
jgi:hypothetical protein